MSTRIIWLFVVVLTCAWPADAQPGREVLRNQGSLRCHTIGVDGIGRDFTDRLVPDYTVPALAAAVWNHTPTMWAEMASTVMAQPAPSEAEWEDVFRYLYVLQFSDRPAVTRRGGRVFESRCAQCHGVGAKRPVPGKPVSEWARIEDPIALVHQMWNHASSMRGAFSGNLWKKLDGSEFLDLTAYLQSVQDVPRNAQASLPDPAEGALLTGLHCGACHGGSDSFAASVTNKTLMDVGAATWNHVSVMESLPVLPRDDFRRIVSYVWELQYRGPSGVASRGQRVFEAKGCLSCHRSPPERTPQSPRSGKSFTSSSLVALSWGAGREMHRQMEEKGVRWPRLSPDDVSNLVAYLNVLSR